MKTTAARRVGTATTVAEVMHHDVVTVTTSMTAFAALERMREQGVRHAPVRDDAPGAREGIVGVMSERDIARFAIRPGHTWLVHDVMSAPPIVVSPDATVAEAAHVFRTRRIGCLPVILGNTLVGIVTKSDLLRILESAETPDAQSHEIPRPVRCDEPLHAGGVHKRH